MNSATERTKVFIHFKSLFDRVSVQLGVSVCPGVAMADAGKVDKLVYLGLTAQKAKETLKNEALTAALVESSDRVCSTFDVKTSKHEMM